jgi:hypothetical protein
MCPIGSLTEGAESFNRKSLNGKDFLRSIGGFRRFVSLRNGISWRKRLLRRKTRSSQ